MNTKLTQIVNVPDRQEAYFQMVDYYLKTIAEEQKEIRDNWNFGLQWVYPNLQRLSCRINEIYSPEIKIIASLTGLSLDGVQKRDWRDDIIGLAIIYHNCLLARISPVKVFERVASASTIETGKFIRDFIRRENKDKSLEAFDLHIVINSDGEKEVHGFELDDVMLDFIEKNGSSHEK